MNEVEELKSRLAEALEAIDKALAISDFWLPDLEQWLTEKVHDPFRCPGETSIIKKSKTQIEALQDMKTEFLKVKNRAQLKLHFDNETKLIWKVVAGTSKYFDSKKEPKTIRDWDDLFKALQSKGVFIHALNEFVSDVLKTEDSLWLKNNNIIDVLEKVRAEYAPSTTGD